MKTKVITTVVIILSIFIIPVYFIAGMVIDKFEYTSNMIQESNQLKTETAEADTVENDAKVHPSVIKIWKDFITHNKQYQSVDRPDSWYFCDNKKDADECAELVVKKIKQATSTSLWWYEKHQEQLPEVGDLYIVTDWEGVAKAIIRTVKVEKVPYKDITERYAAIEGEGDKSLEYWKKVHWAYYSREMTEYGEKPDVDMLIVCEQFETIWTADSVSLL